MRDEIRARRAENLRPYFELGLSFTEISRQTLVCHKTVTEYAAFLGFRNAESDVTAGRPSGHERRRALLAELAEAGKTQQECAEALGVTRNSICKYGKLYDIKFRRPMENYSIDYDRAEAMAAMYRGGKTLQEIGELFQVTRERVRQIISKRHGLKGTDGGQSFTAAKRRNQAKMEKDRRHFDKFGCSREQHSELIKIGEEMIEAGASFSRTPTGAWSSQKKNAQSRDIEWSLSLWDWWQVWQASGKWGERGRRKDKYVMCRFKDDGPYEVGNVYIATLSHNSTLQPNNPYRKGHPDYEKVMKLKRQKYSRPKTSKKRKYLDLPIGVTMQNGRYIAQIGHNGRSLHIGSFSTPEEAGEAYQAKRSELEMQVAA